MSAKTADLLIRYCVVQRERPKGILVYLEQMYYEILLQLLVWWTYTLPP